MKTVLISGGTGMIGRHLSLRLKDAGYKVAVLSRSSDPGEEIPVYLWNIDKQEIDRDAVLNADYLIHLAGAGIGDKRWTKERKKILIDSRVKSGELLFSAAKSGKNKIEAFISISGIGYYGGITVDSVFSETDPPSGDFLSEVCRQWEQTAVRFGSAGIRAVKLRSGIVLSRQGGALRRMMTPVRLGAGAPIGTGKQYLPWIHIDDLCNIFIKAIEDTNMNGTYNAVAPDHVTNKEFMDILSRLLRKPRIIPFIPSILMKILFGEMSVVLLNGSRISSDKIRAAGYEFKFPELKDALRDLL